MNTIKKLGALAALAVLSSSALQAVSVDLSTTTYSGASPFTDTAGNKYYGYYVTNASTATVSYPSGSWVRTDVAAATGTGVGVYSSLLGIPAYVEDMQFGATSYNEYLWIDFGSNYLNKTDLQLKFNTLIPGTVTYFWTNGPLPANGDTTPTLAQVDTSSAPIGGTVSVSSGVGSFQAIGSGALVGQYLVLGSSPLTTFSLNGVTYSQVPDGALTVTLLGAALGGLGLTSFRRRKA